MIEYFLDDLGIVFYNNYCEYPKLLSAQVLPIELKKIAVERLELIKPRLKDFKLVKQNPVLLGITTNVIDGNINYLNSTDQSCLWQNYLKFNERLDISRKQKSIVEIIPEFKQFL